MKLKKKTGLLMAFLAAFFWGISGNAAEFLFLNSDLKLINYLSYRMLLTATLLLAYEFFTNGMKDFNELKKSKKDFLRIILYALFGIIGLQGTFTYTLYVSNAAFATLIQYLAPLIILVYMALKNRKFPKKIEIVLTSVALFGMFLMITAGNLKTLYVSTEAIIVGSISALTFVFYILYIKHFFKYSLTTIIGISMAIGSILLLPMSDFSNFYSCLKDPKILFIFLFSLFFGNIIPFFLFLESTRYISAKLTSLIGAFEPLTALVISVTFMNVQFKFIQIIGAMLIILSVTLLSQKE